MHASMNSKVTFNLTRHDRRWPQAEPPRSVSSHLLPIDLAPHSATKRYIPAQHAPRPEQGAAALKIVDIRQKGVGVGRNSACRRSQCAFRSPTRWVRWDMARFACGSYFFFHRYFVASMSHTLCCNASNRNEQMSLCRSYYAATG